MYFRGDESYKTAVRRIRLETVDALGARINEYLDNFGLDHLIVTFHGGEPLLVGSAYFKKIVERLLQTCSPERLGFTIQTNGILFDDEWAQLLALYNINVGFSLDGPRAIHDKWRVDHKGRPTYDRVVKGLQVAQQAAEYGLRFRGIISVIDPRIPAAEYYAHVTNELGIDRINILLPDADHNSYEKYVGVEVKAFAEYLTDLFDLWWNDVPKVSIRFFEDIISKILGGGVSSDLLGSSECSSIIIDTNGDIEPHDVSRINCGKAETNLNIATQPICEIFNDLSFTQINPTNKIPSACSNCPVYDVCRSGFVPHRYSSANGYDNPSVYCEALFQIIQHVYFVLLRDGCRAVPIEGEKSLLEWA